MPASLYSSFSFSACGSSAAHAFSQAVKSPFAGDKMPAALKSKAASRRAGHNVRKKYFLSELLQKGIGNVL